MLRRRSQRDFEDEIRAHIDLEVERLRAQGLSPQDAERAARRHFGNVGVVEDRFYHAQRFASVQDSGRDLRHAWRALLRTPGFLVTSVVTLGLAIGAALLAPLAMADAQSLEGVWNESRSSLAADQAQGARAVRRQRRNVQPQGLAANVQTADREESQSQPRRQPNCHWAIAR